MDAKELTAKEIFESIKDRKEKISHEELKKYYENCLTLIKKFEITGQKESLNKILFHITCMEKEMKLLDLGIDTYVNYEDIKEFLDKPENKEVLLVALKDYPRDIPDEIVETISKTKDIFTKLYIVFTDYTGEVKKELKKKKTKEKDPILFGAFADTKSRTKIERFYFLGDWIDEYCDLTLEKMAAQGVKKHNISTKTLDEIKSDINSYIKTDEKTTPLSDVQITKLYDTIQPVKPLVAEVNAYEERKDKKPFLSKVKSWLKK